jgi:toxin secretion/phage lysis holin
VVPVDFISKAYVSVAGGLLVSIFGNWHPLFWAFLVLWALDVVTGLIASGKEGKISSTKGTLGIGKKVIIISLIAAAHMADLVLGTGDVIRNATIFWFVVNELVSIAENCGRAGVPLPPKLQKAIDLVKDEKK